MKSKLIAIGNSRGVRLPKALLEQCGMNGNVKLTLVDGGILVSPARKKPQKKPRVPREGWEEQIKAVIDKYGPEPLDEDWLNMPNEWDEKEWTW